MDQDEFLEPAKQDARYPYAVDYQGLRKSLSSATGLSLVDGDPVESIADLPPFKVEIYKFSDSHQAQAFVFGVGLAGLSNKVACTWEPGNASMVNNRTVIVAFLQEEVCEDSPLQERLVVKSFKMNDFDSSAIARHTTESIQSNIDLHKRALAKETEILQPLYDLGYSKKTRQFSSCYTSPSGIEFDVDWPQGRYEGPYKVTVSCHNLTEGSLDVSKELDAAIDGSGCSFDELRESIFVSNLSSIQDVPVALAAIDAALAKAIAARKAVWRADLEQRVKMNASRKRFLTDAARLGIQQLYHRGNQQLWAGAEKIGLSEIGNLMSIGWIEKVDGKYRVSDAGKEKAGVVD